MNWLSSSSIQNIWAAWAVVTSLWLLALSLRTLRFSKSIRSLKYVIVSDNQNDFVWPKVSLIVPACNEATTILPAARSLLSMDYRYLELIIVDDRSTDGTSELTQQLALEDSRVKVVTIKSLPTGWLGKVHALHQGVQASTADWILFSDADVHYQAHSLKKAIFHSTRESLDFLAVIPSVIGGTVGLKIIVAQFIHWAMVSLDLKRAHDPRYRDSLGTGAFNLVRRMAYNNSPGLEWLKMEVVDDGGLALMLKECQAKMGIFSGVGEIELEWYPTFWAFVKGLEKNSFSLMQYSLTILFVLYLGVLIVFFGFTLAPWLSGSYAIMIFTWSSLAIYLALAGYSLRYLLNINALVSLFFPVTFLLIPLIAFRSAVICLYQQGIYWRGTLYPLADLKKGQRVKILNIIFNRSFN